MYDAMDLLSTVSGLAVPVMFTAWTFLRRQAWRHSSSRFKQYVVYLLDALFYRFGRFFFRRMAIGATLKRYATIQLSRADTRYLQVPGGTPLEVDRIFVPLNLASGDEKITDSSLLNFARRSGGRLRILGDPGSGKSSLSKKLYRSICLEVTVKDSGVRTLPILLELKTLNPPSELLHEPQLGDWLLEQLKAAVVGVEGFDTEGLFRVFLTDAGLTIFLDGLDEVSTANYPKMMMAINGLAGRLSQKSSSSVILLTMRTQFHTLVRADLERAYPAVLTIAPFTPGDIFEFLSRYPFGTRRTDKVSRIYADLTDRPTLREMCRNPLVLSMYVAHDQAGASGGVPDSRTAFYSTVSDELLVARRSRQMGTTARTTLREQREAILGHLALENLLNAEEPANHISYRDLCSIIGQVYRTSNPMDIEERLHEIVRDTGILNFEREGESLRFIHLTFCEFLAAKEAALGREQGWDLVRQTHLQLERSGVGASRLVEVLPFTLALLPRVRRPQALSDLAALGNPRIVARALLETQLYGHPVLDVFLTQELAALTQVSPEEWDRDWRDRLHLFLVVLEDARRLGDTACIVPQREEVYERLIANSEDRMLRLFGSYAEHDPAAALRLADSFGVDLTQGAAHLVVKNASNRPFLAMVLDRLATSDRSVQWAVLLSCAGLSSSLAARQMMRLPEVPALQHLVKSAGRGWSYIGYQWGGLDSVSFGASRMSFSIRPRLVETAYTQCLHVASEVTEEPSGVPAGSLRRLQAVRAVKRPNGFLLRGGEAAMLGLAVGMGPLTYILLSGGLESAGVSTYRFVAYMLGGSLVGAFVMTSFASAARIRDRLYLNLVNLANDWAYHRPPTRFAWLFPSVLVVRAFHAEAYRYLESVVTEAGTPQSDIADDGAIQGYADPVGRH